MDGFKLLAHAETEAQMRAAINELARDNALVHQCMRAADIAGLRGEDRYTLLSYHALTALAQTAKAHHELLLRTPAQHFVTANVK